MKKWMILLGAAVLGLYLFMDKSADIKNINNEGAVIVAFGDSLTAGYGARKGASYPDMLAQKITMPVVNLGLPGETAAHAPTRLAQVLEQKPYMVLIEFGANDFMQQRDQEIDWQAVSQIVDEVQKAGAIAVIVHTGGPGMGAYTRAYKKMAKEKQAVFVPGILKDIFNKRQYKSDSVHPNAAGYAIVAEHVYTHIKPYLK
jgi:lysophospholipase L1-like esterase